MVVGQQFHLLHDFFPHKLRKKKVVRLLRIKAERFIVQIVYNFSTRFMKRHLYWLWLSNLKNILTEISIFSR